MRVIEAISQCVNALANPGIAQEWRDVWEERLERLTKALPSGSGFNAGTSLVTDESNSAKIVFNTSFHHMNDNGFYDGWTEHKIICTADFIGSGINIRVTGRNRGDIKEYIADTFHHLLNEPWEFSESDNPKGLAMKSLFDLINQGKYKEAESKCAEIVQKFGSSDPVIIEAETTINNRLWEREAGLL